MTEKIASTPQRASPRCANCNAWFGPAPLSDKHMEQRERAGMGAPKGACREAPEPLPTPPDHWCRRWQARIAETPS